MSAKILFVDDEPDQAKLVQRMFRSKIRAGEIAFLFASDGEEALDVLGQEPDIDLVVSDINMLVAGHLISGGRHGGGDQEKARCPHPHLAAIRSQKPHSIRSRFNDTKR